MRRAIFAALGVILCILLYLLTSASANTPLFARHYPWLLAVNAIVALGLIGLVGWQLRQLWVEYRAQVFGSRLKLRLVLMFGALTVLPGSLVYAVSLQFVTRSIDSWFNVRVENALSSGLALGRTALDALLDDLRARGDVMALELSDRGELSYRSLLNRLREQHAVSSAMLLTRSGQMIATASADISGLAINAPEPSQLRQVRVGRPLKYVEHDADGKLSLRVLVAVTPIDAAVDNRILQLVQPAPAVLSRDAEAVQAVYRDYEQLKLAREGLTQIYAATLTLTVLLAVSGAFALAFVFARRLSAPLSVLAEGTQAVAQGDFTPRQAVYSRDELGVLTQSFNRMTRQLDDARRDTERHRADLESSRAYLESILANLSAGVLVFDQRFHLRHYNQGACTILEDDLQGLPGEPCDAWPRHRELGRAIIEGFDLAENDWQRQVERPRANGMPQFLLIRGSRLPEAADGGFVVVFDDITRMIASERSAAWGEVARRLAHEIKNPLTPIQLSAERLQIKLAEKLDAAGAEALHKSVSTIVAQVQAMKRLVDDFRDYARLPPPELAAVDLARLIAEVLALYENSNVDFRLGMPLGLPPVAGDTTQLRQVVHNLLRNAEDAMAEGEAARLDITASLLGNRVRVVFQDNGPGFPPDIMARAFEPYVTSKQKGTGLGLAIVRKIIDEHHGTITLGNVEPHGARVVFELPLAGSAGGRESRKEASREGAVHGTDTGR
jgi:nitrogen fixation/metabolism regulation signal transduction histidine kinase